MKKYILIILAMSFLISSTELHELLRLPFLVQHYSNHHSENQPLSFFDFLKMHYSNNHSDNNDDSEDMQLPFKSHGNITPSDPLTLHFTEPNKEFNLPLVKVVSVLHPERIPNKNSFSIFHPPRLS